MRKTGMQKSNCHALLEQIIVRLHIKQIYVLFGNNTKKVAYRTEMFYALRLRG